MARMDGATFVGPHHNNGVMARHDVVCIHTIVGRAPAHAAHFSTDAEGTVFQSRDTDFASAANLNGNHRIIAIENEDRGPRFPDWNVKDGHAELGSTGQTLRQAIADAADDRELNAAMATLKARLDAVDAKLAQIASTR